MVSGIGPNTTLAELDIPVLSDLSGVGQNMFVRGIYRLSGAFPADRTRITYSSVLFIRLILLRTVSLQPTRNTLPHPCKSTMEIGPAC